MANTFGTLVTSVQANLDTVLREQIGYIPAVSINAEAAQAAIGQVIQYPIAPVMVAMDGTAVCCADNPCPPDQAFGVGNMVVDHDRIVNLCWTAEEDRQVNNSYGYSGANFRDNQIQQGIRTLVNEVETSIAAVGYNAAQVYTPASTTLFSTQADNFKDLTLIRKLLIDNATPDSDLHLVMNTLSGAQVRNLYNLTRANENASDATVRRGSLLELMNFQLHESYAAGVNRTNGSGTAYEVVGAQTAGDTTVPVDTGTGTILSGQLITFAGNTTVYTVISFSGGIITLNRGLTGPLADNALVTMGAVYSPQLAFKREAIVLAARLPSLIGGEDSAEERAYITDPYSGLTFSLAQYRNRRATTWELGLVWGVKMVKPEMAVLIPG